MVAIISVTPIVNTASAALNSNITLVFDSAVNPATGNYSGVYEVSRVSALRSESEAAQTIPIQDFQSLKPAFFRDPLNGYQQRLTSVASKSRGR